MPSGQLNQATAEHTDLEFALETQSGFLVVVKGSGNDGRVTLAVRRRVGTPPASSVGLTPDEVKRLINLLAELSPAALIERDKHLVGKAREAYLDDLMGSHNQPESGELDLFIERDFPELANKRKRTGSTSKTFLDAAPSLGKVFSSFASVLPRPGQTKIAIFALAAVLVIALCTVALLNAKSLLASNVKVQPEAAQSLPTTGIEEFSKGFVLDMLTFKKENYRQAQVRAMAEMSPDLATKYWQETGFPLTKQQLKSIPQDQEVQVARVSALPMAPGQYQVDVVGAVIAQGGAKSMPLHIRLTVTKDAASKLTVTEQKDLSSAAEK